MRYLVKFPSSFSHKPLFKKKKKLEIYNFVSGFVFKVEGAQKKLDYAERVKARNRILLAEQKQKSEDEEFLSSKAGSVQPSKFQRV